MYAYIVYMRIYYIQGFALISLCMYLELALNQNVPENLCTFQRSKIKLGAFPLKLRDISS